MKDITIFGREIIDDKTVQQLQNCLLEDSLGVLTADGHYGYGHPVGGAVAYKDHISVSGVGFDIACGNMAVRTNVQVSDVPISRIMDEIVKQISFGLGRPNKKPIYDPVLDMIADTHFKPQRDMLSLAAEQLGTCGGGNHFIDLFRDDDGFLWIANHFGSRGFGHKIASGFMAMAQGKDFTDRISEGSMDAPPILLDVHTLLGQEYLHAMELAGEYAFAGRTQVINKVLEILGNPEVTFSVHNHHNFAWKENHFGEDYWVVRKGCTPAFPGQKGFVGANMRDKSVIIEGVDSDLAKDGLYSTVHGAGRILSRNAAAGKKKWLRDPVTNRKRPTVVKPGIVDFKAVQSDLKDQGIELRGAGADEAPECYKTLSEVLQYQGDTIKVLFELTPVGVAMADEDTLDPYKD